MSCDNSSVEICVEYVHETDRAILVSDGDGEVWIPKSQLVGFSDHMYGAGESIDITISEWFAKQKDMI